MKKHPKPQRKVLLRLDSQSKLQSILNKENVPHCSQNQDLIRYRVFQGHSTYPKKQQNPSTQQTQSRIFKENPSELKFKDLFTLHQLQGRKKSQRKIQQKSIHRQTEQPTYNKIRRSLSLPSISKEKKSLRTFNKIYYGKQQIQYDVIDDLLASLKKGNALIQEGQHYTIGKSKFLELLNLFLCIAKTTCKKKVQHIIQNFEQLPDLGQIPLKIFNKIKEKTYYKKRSLRISTCEMSYQFAPEKDEKCKGTVKKTRTRIKSIGELEDDDSDVETRKRAATFKDKSIYQIEIEQNESQLRKMAQSLQFSLSQYGKFIQSEDFKNKIRQFYPFSSVQDYLFQQMSDYYQNILHDKLLVPSLKQKLLNSLITKVFSSFKFDISSYSLSAAAKLVEIQEWIQKINDYTNKYAIKLKTQVSMKSLFILDCENLSFQLNLTHSKIKKLSEMKTMPDQQKVESLLKTLADKVERIQKFISLYK